MPVTLKVVGRVELSALIDTTRYAVVDGIGQIVLRVVSVGADSDRKPISGLPDCGYARGDVDVLQHIVVIKTQSGADRKSIPILIKLNVAIGMKCADINVVGFLTNACCKGLCIDTGFITRCAGKGIAAGQTLCYTIEGETIR